MEHGAKHGAIICCYSASSLLVGNNGAFIAIMYSLHVFHPLVHNFFLSRVYTSLVPLTYSSIYNARSTPGEDVAPFGYI